MKNLIALCVALLCATTALASRIEFIKGDRTEDLRSISIVPTANQDGNAFQISFPVQMENVEIAVKDAAGNLVYSSVVSIPAKQYHSFILNNLEEGDYTLEVTYGDTYFYGYFSL